jgi:hypothetical protein
MNNLCVCAKLGCLKRNPLRGCPLILANLQKRAAMMGFSSHKILLSIKIHNGEKICLAALFV